MELTNCQHDLLTIAKKGGRFPAHISLLFHAANRGDRDALLAIIAEFYPLIQHISVEIQEEYALEDGMLLERLHESAVQTLIDFSKKHHEDGFSKFLLWAFKANMLYTLAH